MRTDRREDVPRVAGEAGEELHHGAEAVQQLTVRNVQRAQLQQENDLHARTHAHAHTHTRAQKYVTDVYLSNKAICHTELKVI